MVILFCKLPCGTFSGDDKRQENKYKCGEGVEKWNFLEEEQKINELIKHLILFP